MLTYFLHGSMVNLLFYCHINLYWERVTSYEKFGQNFTLEVQIVWKINRFNNIDGSIEIFYETYTASCLKQIIQLPQDKNFLPLWNVEQNIIRLFSCFNTVSCHRKLNGTILLSQEIECTSCLTSCRPTKIREFQENSWNAWILSWVPNRPPKRPILTFVLKYREK